MIAHPSECHPRVIFNGGDTHEGTETEYWETTETSSPGRWRTIALQSEGVPDPAGRHHRGGGGGVDTVSDEWWKHPPVDPRAHLMAAGACGRRVQWRPSQADPRGGGIHPNVFTTLPGGLVCYVAFAQVSDGHLGPVGTLRLVDVCNVVAVLCETSIGVVRLLDFHSFLSPGGSWRGIRRWREVCSGVMI